MGVQDRLCANQFLLCYITFLCMGMWLVFRNCAGELLLLLVAIDRMGMALPFLLLAN